MAISKEQANRVTVTCKCGCGLKFSAFPVYKKGGGGLRVPEYKRGHHPNCRKTQLGNVPVWNKGLTADQVPSIGRQGKSGTAHWNYDAEQHPDWFAKDFDFRAFAKKFGHKPRSKGGSKTYTAFRRAIMERDRYTCGHCRLVSNDLGDDCVLQVHHIVYVKHDKTRIFDPLNVITLCFNCHWKVHRRKKVAAP